MHGSRIALEEELRGYWMHVERGEGSIERKMIRGDFANTVDVALSGMK